MRRALCLSLLAVSLVACDSTNDFDCEAVWTDRKEEVIEKTQKVYMGMPGEIAAINRCKQDMLEAVPKGGKRAECQCIGRKAKFE